MLKGDELWCQLFSETEAGSDLANLSTRAVLDGDEWVVNGPEGLDQLGASGRSGGSSSPAPTPTRPKHQGITYFLLDMATPGHRDPAAAADDRRRPLQRGVPRRGAHPGGQRRRRRRATGGRSRRRPSPASAPPSPAAPAAPTRPASSQLAQDLGVSDDPLIRQAVVDAHLRSELLRFLRYRSPDGAVAGQGAGRRRRR